MTTWYDVEPTAPGSLSEARLQVHHAAQVAAAPGATRLPPQDDHSDRNLEWVARLGALVGRPVDGLSAGLRVGDLSWLVVREGHVLASSHQAYGYTLAQGLGWLRAAWLDAGGPDVIFELPGYDLPDHRVAHDGLFDRRIEPGLHRLSAWFADADLVIRDLAEVHGGGEVRVWPHHLDLATLIVLQGCGAAQKSVGVGFSPGDGGIDQPYFYVTPWPYPAADELPELPVGRWNTAGWTGAVLEGSEVRGEAQVRAFLEAGIAAGRSLVG